MSSRPRIGAMFGADRPVGELPDAARALERMGYDELWLVEDCFRYGGLTAAATALACTSQLTVGVGLLPVPLRNPAIAAMELATLAGLHQHRVRIGMGHGVEAWMRQVGARPDNRIRALDEVVWSVRALLRGETVNLDGGYVHLDGVKLNQSPAEVPPVFIGTTGERGIALAAEVADGLILPEGAGETAVRAAANALGHRRPLTVYAWLRLDEDAEAAREFMRPVIEAWRDTGWYERLVALSGMAPNGPIDLADVERLALAGGPEDCAAGIARLQRAGATAVVLMPVGDDPGRQLEWFATDVFPRVLADTLG